jgi:methyl-accepting chemotaxis protein
MTLTKEQLRKLVKESNRHLLEDRVGDAIDHSNTFTQSFPSPSDEVVTARKEKLTSYQKYINTCTESLKNMVNQANADYTSDNLQNADVEFLISDELGRLQTALNYTISSLQAIVENDGLERSPAGPQYPAMMEKKLK